MYRGSCKRCLETPFRQCKNKPCKHRKYPGKVKSQSFKLSHGKKKIIQKINVEESSMEKLLREIDKNSKFSRLLKKNIGIDQLGIEDDPLLIYACKIGCCNMVELLLRCGADPNCRCQYGKTALAYAMSENCTHLVDLLVEYGCNVNDQIDGPTSLDMAVFHNSPKMVKCLLHWGADPNAPNIMIPSSLTTNSNSALILELLLTHGATIDALAGGRTPLASHFIMARRLDLLQLVVERVGLEPCQEQEYKLSGLSLLHVAARQSKADCLAYLLGLRLDVNLLGGTVLHVAASQPWSDKTCQLLLSRGAQLEALNHEGNTALHVAVKSHNHNAVEVLLMAGARADVKNVYNMTPARYTLKNDDEASLELLILFGADTREIEMLATNERKHKKIRLVLGAYAIMQRVAGLSQRTLDIENDKLAKIEETCKKEVEGMKKLKIGRGMSCFDLVLASKRRLVSMQTRNRISLRHLMDLYNSRIVREFPIYSRIIWRNIFVANKYTPIFCKAERSLHEICHFALPTVAIDEIMNYLSAEDMKNIINIAKHRKSNFSLVEVEVKCK